MRIQRTDKKAHRNVLRQSLYIAALDRYWNIQGLIYPYQDQLGYTFDFYAPTHRRLIKVFNEIDDTEIARYLDHPRRKQIKFIIDITHLLIDPLGALFVNKLPKTIKDAAIKLDAAFFIHTRLYTPSKAPDGSIYWRPCPEPYEEGREDGRKIGYAEGRIAQMLKMKYRDRYAA